MNRCLLGIGLATLLIGAGCSSDNDDDYRTRNDDVISRDPTLARDRPTWNDDRYDGRRTGDVTEGISGAIPRDAVRVAYGTDRVLTYRPERDGMVYVYDARDDRVVWSGRVDGGRDFRLDPRGDEVLVNDRSAGRVNLDVDHEYRVYFAPRGSY